MCEQADQGSHRRWFLSDDVKPTGNGQLTGDDGRRASVPVFDEQEISAPEAVKELGGPSLGAGEPTSHEGLLLIVVRHGIPTITNAVTERAGQALLPAPGIVGRRIDVALRI